MRHKWLIFPVVLVLAGAACSDDADTTTTTQPSTTSAAEASTTEAPQVEQPSRSFDAPSASIVVDGDPSDWSDVAGLDVTLERIVERSDDPVEDKSVTIQMAHDDTNVYALFTVEDDYDWNAEDAHLSAAPALMFPVSAGGPHMGAEDDEGEVSAGMVDIWHWELECAAGVESGGAANPAGDGDPGNDATCNFDDEWATDSETREDDNGAGGENSLLGVWTHSNPVPDGPGVWYFEMSRPLQTGDEQDGQFTVGESTLLAMAYWDPDFGSDGWDDSTHVQSANQGWINVNLK